MIRHYRILNSLLKEKKQKEKLYWRRKWNEKDRRRIIQSPKLERDLHYLLLIQTMMCINQKTIRQLHHMLITEIFPLITIILLVPIIIISVQHYLKILMLILPVIVHCGSLRLTKEDTKMSHLIK